MVTFGVTCEKIGRGAQQATALHGARKRNQWLARAAKEVRFVDSVTKDARRPRSLPDRTRRSERGSCVPYRDKHCAQHLNDHGAIERETPEWDCESLLQFCCQTCAQREALVSSCLDSVPESYLTSVTFPTAPTVPADAVPRHCRSESPRGASCVGIVHWTARSYRVDRSEGGAWDARVALTTGSSPLQSTRRAVERDVGIAGLMTMSGSEKPAHSAYRGTQRRLRSLQRRIDRKTTGGSHWRRATSALQREHERSVRIRRSITGSRAPTRSRVTTCASRRWPGSSRSNEHPGRWMELRD